MLEPSKEVKNKAKGRLQFKFQDRLIYEWEQTLDDINIYIQPPKECLKRYEDQVRKLLKPGEQLPKIDVTISSDRLKVGIKGNPPFLDNLLTKLCDSDDSYWLIEDEELHIILQKAFKGELWQEVFKGHKTLDPLLQQEIQKNLLLERFQQEHPGFDFSSADVNGMVPDARTFMGGIKRD
ncbi:NudC domain-containing protein 2 [Paramecium bursaria]